MFTQVNDILVLRSDRLKGGIYIKFRKRDYFIFYVLIVIMYTSRLMAPVKIQEVLKIVILSILPTVLLGTITNFLFRKR